MKETKLTKALASLSKEEFHQFGKFLGSNYFNKSECNIKLYKYLKNFYPFFENPELSKNSTYQAIYPDKKYNDKKLRDRFTHLLNLLKHFFAVEKYVDKGFDFQINLIKALKEKKLYNMVIEECEATTLTLKKISSKNEYYYLKSYLLQVIKREVRQYEIPVAQKHLLLTDIQEEVDHVITFFLIVMLKEFSIISNVARHAKIDYKFEFFEHIMDYLSLEGKTFKNAILINVFYNFFQIYKNKHDESFIFYIRDLLVQNKMHLQDSIFKMLYIELYNYCKRRQSNGEKDYGAISFKLLNDMLHKNVFLKDDGFMSAHTYINLVASGLREGKIDWAEIFINEYKIKVSADERDNAYGYNCAVLFYMKGYSKPFEIKEDCYNIAMVYLNKVKSDDFYYMTRIKNHSLKIFYELNHLESALSLIDSYFHYLSRNFRPPCRDGWPRSASC